MKLPNLNQRAVDLAKISDYLLNPDHGIGAAKARFFAGLGFRPDEPEVLRAALLAHPAANEVVSEAATGFGKKYVVQCTLTTPDGRNPCVRSVWLIEDNAKPRLVTAYPAPADTR